MILRDFALLTDENISPPVVSFLRANGFDVLDVKENGLIGTSDVDLIRLSIEKERVLVTHDQDFGALAFLDREPFLGILFLRPGHISPDHTIDSLRSMLAADLDLQPPFVVVAENSGTNIRFRLRLL